MFVQVELIYTSTLYIGLLCYCAKKGRKKKEEDETSKQVGKAWHLCLLANLNIYNSYETKEESRQGIYDSLPT